MRKRIIIADDHPIFRNGLKNLIQGLSEFEFVGEAGDAIETLKLIETQRPDIAVVDIAMPGMNGLQLIEESRKRLYDGEFVVLTMYKEEEYFREAMDLGAKGYILKESAAADLLGCLLNVAQGRFFVSPAVSDYLIRRTAKRVAYGERFPSLQTLTPMEMRVLKTIADGKSSKETGDDLGISEHTVQNHRAHICTKLGLEGHNKLLRFAIEHKSLL
jgi:DNA-binding NarL/FixJ family response regulator